MRARGKHCATGRSSDGTVSGITATPGLRARFPAQSGAVKYAEIIKDAGT